MTSLIRAGTETPARAYCGMWIVDCPCSNAIRVDPSWPAVDCHYCGRTLEIRWPPDQMRRGVERLLMLRPLPHTRNWNPHETLTDLHWENGAHGIYDTLPDALPGTTLLAVTDERIIMDILPADYRHLRSVGA